MEGLTLLEYVHPDENARKRYEGLVGMDYQKHQLLFTLKNILDEAGLIGWLRKHHKNGLPYFEDSLANDPLVILTGDVGCGKTELAHTIPTALSDAMNGRTIVLFETPSNIRGGGHVGQISSKINAAFDYAKRNIRKNQCGILLIDEADDLVTNRDQTQAHHEDRAGVNVIIKELDKVRGEKISLAVLMITNRPGALDPAVTRRAALQLKFERPDKESLRKLLAGVFRGVEMQDNDLELLVNECLTKKIPFSFSDIAKKVAKQSLILAWQKDKPLNKEIILEILARTEPSPIIVDNGYH